MLKTTKLLSVLASLFALSTPLIHADNHCSMPADCSYKMLDTNNYGVMFGTCGAETKKLVFCGLIQTDYQFVRVENDMAVGARSGTTTVTEVVDPTDRNNFLIRRIRLGIDADLGNHWHGHVTLDYRHTKQQSHYVQENEKSQITSTATDNIIIRTPNPTILNTRNKHGIFGIHKAYVEKIYGGNAFKAGYKKVNFGREEIIEPAYLKVIERSIASEYFNACGMAGNISGSPLAFGRRHVGLFMDGMYNNIGYGLSVVNGFQGNSLSALYNNELGVFGNLYYSGEFNCIELEVGINAGYKPKGNNFFLTAVHNNFGQDTFFCQRGSISAINPYITANWKKFSIFAEFLGSDVEHGAVDATRDAKPYGFTVIPSYMINDQLEIVGRYSYLDTDFRGTLMKPLIPGVEDTTSITTGSFPSATIGDIYDNAFAWYIGFNYYMMNGAVKFSAGYEFFQFKDRHTANATATAAAASNNVLASTTSFIGDKSRIHLARARIQLVF